MRAARRAVGTICALALLALVPVAGPSAGAASTPDAAGGRAEDQTGASQRPNVLLIVSDDQASSVFSRTLMPTVFGQIADQGVLFRRAYVNTALCCPSRSQILTGLYEHDTGVDANDTQLERPTIVQALDDAGYRTYLAGKYLNSWTTCEPRPEFDQWACVVAKEPSSNSLLDPTVNVNGVWRTLNGYQPDVLGDMLVEDIRKTPEGQPFFALYAPTTPHMPADDPRYDDLEVTPPRGKAFDANTMNEAAPRFARRTPLTDDEIAKSDERYTRMARATRSFDDAVGDVLAALGDRAENTLVVYISDNGFLYGEHRRFGKNDAWEESVRVPMAMRFPTALDPGRSYVTDALVQNVDIAPTIADLVGFPWGADGRSMVPLLTRSRSRIRTAALIEHCRGVNRGSLWCSGLLYDGGSVETAGFQGIVTSRYKYVRYDDGSEQLIDLKEDPQELGNLLAGPAGRSSRVSALRAQLTRGLANLMRPAAQTTIATGPGPLTSRVATFTFFSPSRSAGYRCKLSRNGAGAAWHPCPNQTASYGNLADGRYRFEVVGTDDRGRWDRTPAARSFLVDTEEGPTVSFSARPPARTGGDVSFSFESSDSEATFQCRLTPIGVEPGGWELCDRAATFSGLAAGTYAFEVLAEDPSAKTVSRPAAGWVFQVDPSGPVQRFIVAPPSITRERRATFEFVADEGSRGKTICSVDGGPARDCSGGRYRTDSLKPGTHTLAITATDALGQAGVTRFEWVIDTTRPAVAVNEGPPRYLGGRMARFDLWSDSDPAFFLCRLDGGPSMPCFTAAELTGLRDGKHRFVAIALDAAMNRSDRVVYRWTVDTIAPGLVLTGTPAAGTTTTSNDASFEIWTSEPGTIFCRVDAAEYHPCDGRVGLDGLATGEHAFSAYVVDRAGNRSIEAGWSWTVV